MTEVTQEAGAPAAAPLPTSAEAALPSSVEAALPTSVEAALPAPGGVRRVVDWFWRGRQLKQLRREASLDSARERELTERAELLFELGERTRKPAERLPQSAEAAAAELYRQSAYFAIRALALASSAAAEQTQSPWQTLSQPFAEKLASSREKLEELSSLVEHGTFLEPWELSNEQRSLRVVELAGAARKLLDELSWRMRARDALWIQRLSRIGLLLFVVLATLGAVRFVLDRGEQARDLAVGKAWRTSSSMGGIGCTSPLQQCSDNADFFFHTQDENGPWLEIDLGKPTQFSAVRVDNRRDCCFERATPLVIEASNQQQHFHELARRTTTFSSWLATFPPTEARYVRVRSPSHTILHLAQVRVLR